MSKIRCAIYTRKSSEEGLEQDFNSLHAQREACAAYILSQASEGWSLLPGEYDDGGLSGGTLERPALKRLLADIDAGKIDIVVVYKVDRLTRSLLDFARLVEALDKAGTSFVSVTQSFNTTTSMGRLTLNMLLSFAQFEREVTAERIRDKIAASKAKGMWMGGVPPLGYEPNGRTLAIVEEDAQLIRELFRRYLAIGNVRLLKEQLDNEGTEVPERITATGRSLGGVPFTRGQIYKILSNPIYLGEIHHKGKAHDGKHDAIIERELWDQVQAKLTDNAQGIQRAATVRSPSLLAGRVFDEAGEPLVATHACKDKVRYRYYVSRSLQHDPGNRGGMRIPAMELEKAIAQGAADLFDTSLNLTHAAGLDLRADQVERLGAACARLAGRLRKREPFLLRKLISAVHIHPEEVRVTLSTAVTSSAVEVPLIASAPDTFEIRINVRLKRTGMAMRLVQDNGTAAGMPEPQRHLAKLLQLARSWWTEMLEHSLTAAALASRRGLNKSYVSRVIRLNFLAPDIVEAILRGEQPASLDAKTLVGLHDLSLCWAEQKRQLHLQ